MHCYKTNGKGREGGRAREMTASYVDNSCNVGKGGAANREGRRGKQHNPSSQIKSIEVAHTQWQDKK